MAVVVERPSAAAAETDQRRFRRRLNRVFGWYTAGFLSFVVLLAALEQLGLPKAWIGLGFLLATVGSYAVIGVLSRTTDTAEYYVAGRRVPAVYNGMATAADWMSAASFIGMAGTLYLAGFDGLAFVLGWTGGFVLVALFLAPYLRKFGQYTIPDFLGERYGGDLPRLIGIAAAVLCSFTYVVAQIYGVGLITSRLIGVDFVIGVFLGLGGMLVCSFLGGMRAVTWTQVAQYVIIIIAYLIPVVWLSVKQTGIPLPQAVYGMQLEKVTAREAELKRDPGELAVIAAFKAKADEYGRKLVDVAGTLAAERDAAERRFAQLKAANAPLAELQAAGRALRALPDSEESARALWSAAQAAHEARARPLGGMPAHGAQFGSDSVDHDASQARSNDARLNFVALVFCLTVGTAGLPHILMRCYTTPSVREARESVTWSMLFIFLLYFTAPALAVMVKYEVLTTLVGTPFDQLPAWIGNWARVDPSLLSVVDTNGDGILQLGEMKIGSDIIVLATPEIANLPYVVSGLVAAGGLAAALSTADGLLLTIANALSHDLYYKMVDPQASTARRVAISKALLLVVALGAAVVAAQKPGDILLLVSAAFSLAAAAFFPALVLGIFWKRANRWGAVLGMLAGLGITVYYMALTHPSMRGLFGIRGPVELWWGIQPVSAGIFGVPLGFAVIVAVSLLTRPPDTSTARLVERLRVPRGPHDRRPDEA